MHVLFPCTPDAYGSPELLGALAATALLHVLLLAVPYPLRFFSGSLRSRRYSPPPSPSPDLETRPIRSQQRPSLRPSASYDREELFAVLRTLVVP
jgi:hypothetical protein